MYFEKDNYHYHENTGIYTPKSQYIGKIQQIWEAKMYFKRDKISTGVLEQGYLFKCYN